MGALTQKEKIGYGIGDLGINLNFQLVNLFLAYFYTDIFGISPIHVAGLFFVARLWDAVNDPIFGYIIDKTNSRWGRFRPYLLFGAIPLNVFLVAMFFTPHFSETGKVIYAYITYIGQGMLFTLVGVPYNSLSAAITQDQQERTILSSWRMFFAVIIGVTVIGMYSTKIVDLFSTPQKGWFFTALIYGIASTLIIWFTFFNTEEKIKMRPEKYHLKDVFAIIFKNEAMLILSLTMFTYTCIWTISGAVTVYYFKYILGNSNLITSFFFIMLPVNIVSIIVTPLIARILDKPKIFILAGLLVALAAIARFYVSDHLFWLFLLTSALLSFGQMTCSIVHWGMLPDAVEYGQWKTGLRSEGLTFSFFTFLQKASMAFGSSFAMFALFATGYIANTELSQTTISVIRYLFNISPAVFAFFSIIMFCFYKLDRRKFKQILSELNHS